MSDIAFSFRPIGRVHSPYVEKFGIPRQPSLVDIPSQIEIEAPYARAEAFRGLADFSHIWVHWVFHKTLRERWKPTVRPPRLGGNQRVGVFASRSMFRPNALGLSVVELLDIEQWGERMLLHLRGADMLDGTPVLDIKPYLPYVDAIPDARAGYAEQAPQASLQVEFSAQADAFIAAQTDLPSLKTHLTQILALDPRPAYQPGDKAERDYAMRLYRFDIHWRADDDRLQVVSLETVSDHG